MAFALGMSRGESILSKIESKSKYVVARNVARKLASRLEKGETVRQEYRSPVKTRIKLNGDELLADASSVFDDPSETECLITRLSETGTTRAKKVVKQFNALFYDHLT